eukprot:gnl/MRDRNA2_/MRDRNA2_57648_c0_seq1.p1 gnl/MRDRNA2_/MRDRNA2_57648_c0~~gnl/MRDRNA2_/MRDRNA2_57648_c0_seq1.p1  ORF type:complete len:196 (+),score=35.52 gnl/MRDRNA2_/MRDRNA2_57648_c0_seq1:72-659(+)
MPTELVLNVQTLAGNVAKIEVSSSALLRNLLSAIERELSMPVCVQKLIYCGEVLDLQADSTVEQAGLTDGDCIDVVHVEPNYCGRWQYHDGTEHSGTRFHFVILKAEEHHIHATCDGVRTGAELVCTIVGQHILIKEKGPTISNCYEGDLSNDGLEIHGQWTCTSAGHGFGEGDSGDFSLKRVVVTNANGHEGAV